MASKYMKIRVQADTNIRVMISITELSMRFICMQKIIIITGIQIAMHEFNKNLHLITACLSSHLRVSHKFDRVRLMLFTTASQAE